MLDTRKELLKSQGAQQLLEAHDGAACAEAEKCHLALAEVDAKPSPALTQTGDQRLLLPTQSSQHILKQV